MTGPLSGMKVVDVSAAVAGPWAATQLSQLGAEVVMIERVDAFDVMRLTGPVVGDQSGAWIGLHGGKRAIELNLQDERGVRVVHQLVGDADVFIQNFRPGVADRLGIGYEALDAVNSRLVYVSVSGFGASGPYSNQPVYDPIIQGLSGVASAQNGDYVKSFVADKTAAMTATNAALAALLARHSTGRGQHVEVNLLDSMIAWSWPDIYWNQSLPDEAEVPTYSEWYSPYGTSDGQVTANWTNFRQYLAAAHAVGRPDLADDERFATRESRLRHSHEMRAEFGAALAKMTTAEALDSLREHDVPSGPVLDRESVVVDPQVVHNGILTESDHPTAGRSRAPRAPARFSSSDPGIPGPSPGKGEHTGVVLSELGYTLSEVADLREDGVIGETR